MLGCCGRHLAVERLDGWAGDALMLCGKCRSGQPEIGTKILASDEVSLWARGMSDATRRPPLGQRQTHLITYDTPPLVEVAMSLQFDPPKGVNQAHLGAFWATQRNLLPIVRAVQPIVSPNEDFGNRRGQWLPPSLQLALTNEPDCRLQMISSDEQWMCQVQRDRLVINWRKRSEQYPRFSSTWSRFRKLGDSGRHSSLTRTSRRHWRGSGN